MTRIQDLASWKKYSWHSPVSTVHFNTVLSWHGHKAKISEGFTDSEHFRVWRLVVKCLFSSIVLVYKWGNWGEKRLQLSKCQLQTELELVPGTAILSTRAGAHLSVTFLWENLLIGLALDLMLLKGLCNSYAILVWYAFTGSVGLCIW